MGAIQAKFASSSKESEMPSDFGDSGQEGDNKDLKAQSSTLSLEAYSQKKNQLKLFEAYRMLRFRLPYLIEDTFGINLNYYTSIQIPNNLITSNERRMVKENNTEDIKKLIFKGLVEIDDPIDSYAKHTLLHDAVIMNREELFDFLLS
jgi:hypothetical protein